MHDSNYCRGIAMVLQGESLKAKSYVTHRVSLGVLREKMVSSFIRKETPERFRVETGLIRCQANGLTSRQCDLLVHEPKDTAPLYRWEDFVVVHHRAARAVVEVKSRLDKADFQDLLDIHRSLAQLEDAGRNVFIPTFGYALSGPAFETFLDYVREAIDDNALKRTDLDRLSNIPVCIAVQEKHYVVIRPTMQFQDVPPFCLCAIDLTKMTVPELPSLDGIETGFFLEFYGAVLRERADGLLNIKLNNWFNQLPIEQEGKVWIAADGTLKHGNTP